MQCFATIEIGTKIGSRNAIPQIGFRSCPKPIFKVLKTRWPIRDSILVPPPAAMRWACFSPALLQFRGTPVRNRDHQFANTENKTCKNEIGKSHFANRFWYQFQLLQSKTDPRRVWGPLLAFLAPVCKSGSPSFALLVSRILTASSHNSDGVFTTVKGR